MSRVYTIGETTFDIIFKDSQPIDAKVGGSVLNTSVSLGRLGIPVSFVSAFGNDQVGEIAMNFLKTNNIDSQWIHRFEGSSRIALAFLDDNNNANYSFYQSNAQAVFKFPKIQKGDIILFGSSHAVREDIREELITFIKAAAAAGAVIVYDPNFRKSQLSQFHKIKPRIEENISLATVVKGSDEDFASIFNSKFSSETYSIIKKISKACLVCTANQHGVYIHTDELNKHYSVPTIQPVSTIGAGDTFNAGIIYTLHKNKISQSSIHKQTESFWDQLVQSSVTFAQHVCMSYDNYLSPDFISSLGI